MRPSIARRFLTGTAIVVGVAAVTIFVVDALVGPAIFHSHLMQAGSSNPETVLRHVEEAARSANLLALALAILIAVVAALLVSVYLATRVSASLAPLTAAARDVASGDYSAQVSAEGLGAEFDELTDTFNSMSQRLSRMEQSRARLFSDLAHEMRTPLAVVQAQLEAIEDGVVSVEQSTPVLRAQVDRLTRLSSDIGLLSRAQEHALTYEFGPRELAPIVRACVDAVALSYQEAGVALRLNVETSARAELDSARFAQVITNLLTNALNATPRGGHVRVSVTARPLGSGATSAAMAARGREQQPPADIHAPGRHEPGGQELGRHEAGGHEAGRHEAGRNEAGRHEAGRNEAGRHEAGRHEAGRNEAGRHMPRPSSELVVQVSDDGAGISADELAHVFDRFTRLGPTNDRSRGGFGIGLTVARSIVAAHHGRISAESAGPGTGAVFTVTVPALPEA